MAFTMADFVRPDQLDEKKLERTANGSERGFLIPLLRKSHLIHCFNWTAVLALHAVFSLKATSYRLLTS